MQMCEKPRKRQPLIRPVCPVHGVAMVVYTVRKELRYHQCPVDGCDQSKKTPRRK